jgi:hypothetical protein
VSRTARASAAAPVTADDVALVEGDGPQLACTTGCEAQWLPVDRTGPERFSVAVDRPSAGLLVVAEQWDRGWRARVDGTPARVIPVDVSQVGVEVPAGSHRVTFSYTAPGLRAGLVTTGVAAALVAGMLLAPSGRRRRP